MFDTFISSRYGRWHGGAGTVISAAAHAGVIALAVAATSRPVHYGTDRYRVHSEHLQFVNAREVLRTASRLAAAGMRAVSGQRDPLRLALERISKLHLSFDAPVQVPVVTADMDYTGIAQHALSFTDSAGGDVDGLPLNPTAEPGKVYTERNVERTVLPRDGNPRPRYPLFLEQVGIAASFTVRFVVDTTGRVEESSIEFPGSAHRLFIDAVRRALQRSRYWPAMIAGQRVRQMVEQTFTFRLAR